jgi:drug/metabolite transporter (DMT)-like permease
MTVLTHDVRPRTASGLGLAVLSAASFGLSGPLARGLLDAGWTPAAAVAVRVLLAGLVLAPAAVLALRGRWSLLRRSAGTVVAYGLVAVAGCQLAYFTAVGYMQVGVALLVEYTAPVLVVGWLWLRHAQRPNRFTVAGAVIAVAGLVLVLDLLSGADVSLVGILWALGATVGAATYFVLSADESRGLPGVVLAAGGLLVGGAALLVAGAAGVVPMAASAGPVALAGATVPWWVPVLVLGLVTAALAYVAGIAASRRLGSRLASFVALLEVLFALVFSAVLLGQVPGAVQLLGGALVLAGVVAVRLGERPTRRGAR